MRLLLRSLLVVLLAAGCLSPDIRIMRRRGQAPTAGCSTITDSATAATSATMGLGYNAGTTYNAQSFVAGSSYTLCAVDVYLTKVSTPTYTLNAYIYSNVSSLPGSLVGTGSSNVSASTVAASEGAIKFSDMSASLTSGTTYWIVLKATGSPNNGTTYITTAYSTGGLTVQRSTDGTAWTLVDTAVSKYRTYK